MIVQKPEAEKRLGKKLPGRKTDWFLLSSIGTRKLGGPYDARSEAVGREKQVQYWKRQANPGRNPLRKIAEMHPDDRAIVGSAVGSVAGFMVAPPLAPIGAAVGHIAGKRLGGPKQNPLFGGKKPPKKRPPKRKRHRSLRNIALDIKKNWKDLRHVGPESRRLLQIRAIVDTMQTLCHPSDIVEEGASRGKSGDVLIGDFLAKTGGLWKGVEATRLKDELRALVAEQYWHDEPIENPRGRPGLRSGRPGTRRLPPQDKEKTGDWEVVGRLDDEWEEFYRLTRVAYGETWTIDAGFKKKPTKKEYFHVFYTLSPGMITGPPKQEQDWKRVSPSGYMPPEGWQSLFREAVNFADDYIKEWLAAPKDSSGRMPIKRRKKPNPISKNPEKNPRPFASRTHDWNEVLIQKDGKRVTRKQILDYYWKNRKKIWPFLEGQTVLVVLAPKKNEFVLIRKRGSDGKHIKLTKLSGIDDENSFEYWINRRVVEFHPVLTGKKTPILWLDIDIHAKSKAKRTALRAKAKKAFPKLRKIMREFGVAKIYAYDSGIDGYHLEGPLKAPKGVDKLRKDFTAALKAAFADDPIFTTGIAQPGQIRLDTTTLRTLGSLRAPHSFTVAGGTKKRI